MTWPAAASTLMTLREAVGADEFATMLGPALSATNDGIFEWLSLGQPVEPVLPPERADRTTCLSTCRRRGPGRAVRPGRGSGPAVLGPLAAFLDAHRDEQVIVEWRVQE